MRSLALLRHARGLAALGSAAVVLTTVVQAAAPTARADNIDTLQTKVAQLEKQVAVAEQKYSAVLSAVGGSVNLAIEDKRATTQLAQQSQSDQAQMDARVRGLYEAGGPLAIYTTLLDAGNVTDLENQAIVVSAVLSGDRAVVDAGAKATKHAAKLTAAAQQSAATRITTERSVALVASRVVDLLAQEQQLLQQAQDAQLAAELAAQQAAFQTITNEQIQQLQVLPPSAAYLSLYKSAARTCTGLSWTILAAIGQVESGHGRDTSTSYAGAMGPMQFEPDTFATYAVDGDGDGQADIMDPADAIYTAAHYLCSNGAGASPAALARAIWHYNHAAWYVQMVLTLAQKYSVWNG